MSTEGFALFETPIGTCAVAWGDAGITGAQLPERDDDATRARMRRRFPLAVEGPPPPSVQAAVDGLVAGLRGEQVDLSDVVLDLSDVDDFARAVYTVARTIAPGTTTTYGEIAARVGAPGASRAVGQALGRNPYAPFVPCHRVLAAGQAAHAGGRGRFARPRLSAVVRRGRRSRNSRAAHRRAAPQATHRRRAR
jgi:methylated-DNA-[protein]-cysteine S-methyltransferase